MKLFKLLLLLWCLGCSTPHQPVETAEMAPPPPVSNKTTLPKSKESFDSFLHRLGKLESNNRYDEINQIGMLGRWQFSPKTLAMLGYTGSSTDFLSDPFLQDSLMIVNLKKNYESLKKLIVKWDNKWKENVFITKSGILAGAHLVGVGGILSFLYPEKYSYPIVDGNGVSVAVYLNRFSNYNISFTDTE